MTQNKTKTEDLKEENDSSSDSESDDNETNLVSQKIKELKIKNKKERKDRKIKRKKEKFDKNTKLKKTVLNRYKLPINNKFRKRIKESSVGKSKSHSKTHARSRKNARNIKMLVKGQLLNI